MTMVNEAYMLLNEHNKPETIIIPPLITEISTTRLHWKNVESIMTIINRDSEHYLAWLKTELTNKEISWYSGLKSDGLIFHGKRQKQSDILEITYKYINNFVICSSCKQHKTDLNKITQKKYEFKCNNCGFNRITII